MNISNVHNASNVLVLRARFRPMNCVDYFIDQIPKKDAQIDFYCIKKKLKGSEC